MIDSVIPTYRGKRCYAYPSRSAPPQCRTAAQLIRNDIGFRNIAVSGRRRSSCPCVTTVPDHGPKRSKCLPKPFHLGFPKHYTSSYVLTAGLQRNDMPPLKKQRKVPHKRLRLRIRYEVSDIAKIKAKNCPRSGIEPYLNQQPPNWQQLDAPGPRTTALRPNGRRFNRYISRLVPTMSLEWFVTLQFTRKINLKKAVARPSKGFEPTAPEKAQMPIWMPIWTRGVPIAPHERVTVPVVSCSGWPIYQPLAVILLRRPI